MTVDLIAGVIRGADPSAAHQVKKRLASQAAGPSGLFEKILKSSSTDKVAGSVAVAKEDILATVIAAADPTDKTVTFKTLAAADQLSVEEEVALARMEVAQELEASVLTSLLTEVMPQQTSLYGDDAAGDMVRQFEIGNLAEAAATTQPLRLADSLFGSAGHTRLVNQSQWPYFARKGITPYAS